MAFKIKNKDTKVDEPVVEAVEAVEAVEEVAFEAASVDFSTSDFSTLSVGAVSSRMDVFAPESCAWRGRMIGEGLI